MVFIYLLKRVRDTFSSSIFFHRLDGNLNYENVCDNIDGLFKELKSSSFLKLPSIFETFSFNQLEIAVFFVDNDLEVEFVGQPNFLDNVRNEINVVNWSLYWVNYTTLTEEGKRWNVICPRFNNIATFLVLYWDWKIGFEVFVLRYIFEYLMNIVTKSWDIFKYLKVKSEIRTKELRVISDISKLCDNSFPRFRSTNLSVL